MKKQFVKDIVFSVLAMPCLLQTDREKEIMVMR